MIRIDGGLFFATAAALDERVRAILASQTGLHTLVLDLEGVNFVDSQGAAKMSELHELTDTNGVELRLARLKPDVADVLEADGLIDLIGRDRIHGNVQRAVQAAQAASASRQSDVAQTGGFFFFFFFFKKKKKKKKKKRHRPPQRPTPPETTVPQIALLALAILVYTLTAARLDRLSISGPIVLVTVGALLGPAGVGAVTAPAASEPFRVLAELTLALLLFSDASTIGLREAGGIAWLPGRLLAIGLPLTIAGGALVGWLLFPALGIGFALVLGSILAPTDAALSLPVLLDRAIPVRVRRTINIESGLNDGIAAPFVALSLAIAVAEETAGTRAGWSMPVWRSPSRSSWPSSSGGLAVASRSKPAVGAGRREPPNPSPSSRSPSSRTQGRPPSAGTASSPRSGPGSPSGLPRGSWSHPWNSQSRSDWLPHTSCGCCSGSDWRVRRSLPGSTRPSSPTRFSA